ncbi:MAG: hypothetical protein AAGF97_10200 [Planctomycetota bacterium]
MSEIVREGDQRSQRKQVRASVLIGIGVVLGCWVWGTTVSPTDQPVPVRAVAPVAAGEGPQLDEAIRALEVQIAMLDEVWRDYDRTRSYAADYRDYVRRDLDHRLATGLAANTLLHDARLEPAAERRQEKLQRVVEHFEGTAAAAEAVSLIAARPL